MTIQEKEPPPAVQNRLMENRMENRGPAGKNKSLDLRQTYRYNVLAR